MKMHSLYTGSVASGKHDQGEVHIDFDDGDSSKIPLEQIRLLPADYMLPQSNGYEETQVPAASLKTNNCKAKKSTNTSSGAACSNGSSHSSGNSTESAYWRWHGPCLNQEQKATTKVYYQTIVRDNDVISCGDCAIFLSHGRPNLPYIGLIESMWESWASTMVVRVRWFYHPEEMHKGRKKHLGKNALFKSTHIDENDVQTISHICQVLSYEEFRQRKAPCGKHIYYCAGTYDPSTGQIIKLYNDTHPT
uniref:BAH domain-containing protein n=1 Tax=Ciona savignyi TaxID=51511 RepID=H2Z7L1_CIOSA